MEAYVVQWLQLGARWLHLIAGAAWIGTSFYFNWLNHSLRPPESPRAGVDGELWSVHGGGFYQVGKYAVAPEHLPERLHWFKWEAYVTWISGVALLVLVYYMGAGGFMLDPAVSSIGGPVAIGIGVATLVAGWFLYDGLCRSPLARRPLVLAVVLYLLAAAVAFGLSHVLSARAAYVHVGAMVGTWMAANVFFVIIPAQRDMVDAMEAGGAPDPERGKQGALRSLHNNYLTLPVLFIMISNHYPVTYAHPRGWLILAAIGALGVLARHGFNRKHQGRPAAWILPTAVAGMVLVAALAAPPRAPRASAPDRAAGVAAGVARAVVDARCVPCHASSPVHPSVAAPPLGIALETDEQVRSVRDRALAAVSEGRMPLGNLTGMTDEERAVLVRWLEENAPRP